MNTEQALKLENALNFTEHLGDSSDSVRRLLEDHKKKDSGKTLSPLVVSSEDPLGLLADGLRVMSSLTGFLLSSYYKPPQWI